MDEFVNQIEQHIKSLNGINKVVIAYSGGVDSHVLLHACSKLQKTLDHLSFLAVYIDHGLHDDSLLWAEHCKKITGDLNVPFVSKQVYAKNDHGEGPEQAARRARYKALSGFIDQHSVLLTAQHQDDQAETLMLQLLRGAGLDGLASMPVIAEFYEGFIVRPFLGYAKQQVLQYAQKENLVWIEDSSNLDVSYDRNFLRQEVIPLIQSRWPAFSRTTARSASHCAEAASILADICAPILSEAGARELPIAIIKQHNEAYQRLIIREWLKIQGVRVPSKKQLLQIQGLLKGDARKVSIVEWSNHQVRLFDEHFYYKEKQSEPIISVHEWLDKECQLPEPLGQLIIQPSKGLGVDRQLWDSAHITIRSRQGGESIQLAGRSGRKTLKKLLNEERILPWVRNSLPLIYLNDELVAVADLWLDERYLASAESPSYTINWLHPAWRIK